MSAREPREQLLERLLRDARAEAPAELDWTGLEERLMQSAAQPSTGQPRGSRSRLPFGAATLAIAAAAALWLAGRPAPNAPKPTPSAVVTVATLHRNGDELPLGQRLSANEGDITVEHANRATWTLARGSRGLLASRGDVITIRLEEGSVLSQVVPNPKPETFVVEAAGARIAVHGTVFRVQLQGGRVVVEVLEGTVAVGAQGETPGFFLKPPARGNFSADGRSGSVAGAPTNSAPGRRLEPQKFAPPRLPSSAAESPVAAPIPSAELLEEPPIDDIESGVTRIVDAASNCFGRHTASGEGVQITVHTAISVTIAASGSVSGVQFQPPLSPEAEACATASVARVTFAPSRRGTSVTRMLELKH